MKNEDGSLPSSFLCPHSFLRVPSPVDHFPSGQVAAASHGFISTRHPHARQRIAAGSNFSHRSGEPVEPPSQVSRRRLRSILSAIENPDRTKRHSVAVSPMACSQRDG
jgi:hypothetical protein